MNDKRLAAAIDMQIIEAKGASIMLSEFVSDLAHTCKVNGIEATINKRTVTKQLEARGHKIQPTGCPACGGRISWQQT